MDKDFWLERWRTRDIGFHTGMPNPLLVAHCSALNLRPGQRVFLPLCGKTLDIHWLMTQGLGVLGAELSETAVTELFAELGLTPKVTGEGALTRYAAEGIDILLGDIFDVNLEHLGAVDAIYDRAALVALPENLRRRYSHHLMALCPDVPQLLITFAYDQSQMSGPPFSVSALEVETLYAQYYRIKLLFEQCVEGGLKGQCDADELLFQLLPLAGRA